MNTPGMTPLSEEGCWEALRSDEYGRLAYLLDGQLQITPVNYAVDGKTLLFRTAEGSKLLGVRDNPDVVFEIDAHDDKNARSVVVRGTARVLSEEESHRAENVPLRPWLGGRKDHVVEISPVSLSGRWFELHRPWMQMRIDRH